MGVWAAGPFDNDIAADWCNDLDDAPRTDRAQRVRAALAAAADEPGFLDGDVAFEAVAAAAVVASQQPGGAHLVQTAYAPDFLEAGEFLDLPLELRDLACRALDRVTDEESEWPEMWSEDEGGVAAALGHLARLRELLAR
jgi:hypothetical protein